MGFENEKKLKYALEQNNGKIETTISKLTEGEYDEFENKEPGEIVNWAEQKKADYQNELLYFEEQQNRGQLTSKFNNEAKILMNELNAMKNKQIEEQKQ